MKAPSSRSNRSLAVENLNPEPEIPFPIDEYQERVGRIRQAMEARGVDVLFCSAPESIYYVTGYQAEWYQAQSTSDWPPASGVAIHLDHVPVHFESEEEVILVRYTSVSEQVCLSKTTDTLPDIIAEVTRRGWLGGTVALEMGSYRPNRLYSERFQSALEKEGCRVVDGTQIVRQLRKIKSSRELECTREAQRIADEGFAAVANAIEPGMTELEVYGELVAGLARAGGENPGIVMPVLSGAKTGCGHGLASRKIIAPGDVVNVDLCGVFKRYHVNMARSFSMGQPSAAVAGYFEKLCGAGVVWRESIAPGEPVRTLVEALRAHYDDVGILADQAYVGGYELGIAFPPDWVGQWHWGFDVDPAEDVWQPGMVSNLEGLFYLPEAAGRGVYVNTVVVTEVEAEFNHATPSELIVIEHG